MFFFFKQKTAYEMRISDWSSDVCSSDLRLLDKPRIPATAHPFHYDRKRLRAHSVDMQHAYAVSLEHLHHAHLVFERIWMRAPLARDLEQKIIWCASDLVRSARHPTQSTLANEIDCRAPVIYRNLYTQLPTVK